MDRFEKIDCRAFNKAILFGNSPKDEKRSCLSASVDMSWSEKIDYRASNKAVLKCALPLHLLYVKNVLTEGSQYTFFLVKKALRKPRFL